MNDAALDALLANPPDGETWVIEFRALPSPVPEAARYRALLKHALRTLHLKCISIRGKTSDNALTLTPETRSTT